MSHLLELHDIINRVVAARVSDQHSVEDLVQETLVRVAAVEARLDDHELQAYAIVTARNLVIDAARRQGVHQRHAHRLVDYTTLDGPEQLALDEDESRALAVALDQLDAADRELLLRHEVDDISTRQLGNEYGLSPGGIAMRLARARARLRLDFVLAFRHVTLPTAHCRTVLLAMSAGDQRRQRTLHAGNHLLQCGTCAELADPVTQRRRGIAAWLLFPAAEALRHLWMRLRTSRVVHVAAIAAATVAVAASIISIQPDTSDNTNTQSAALASPTSPPSTTAPSTTPSTTEVAVADNQELVGADTPASVPTPCRTDILDAPDAAQHVRCVISPTAITATDVATDEGFLAVTAQQATIWVQLVGTGESPINIENGTVATITGTITATNAGEQPSDQRAHDIGWYIQVDYNNITAN